MTFPCCRSAALSEPGTMGSISYESSFFSPSYLAHFFFFPYQRWNTSLTHPRAVKHWHLLHVLPSCLVWSFQHKGAEQQCVRHEEKCTKWAFLLHWHCSIALLGLILENHCKYHSITASPLDGTSHCLPSDPQLCLRRDAVAQQLVPKEAGKKNKVSFQIFPLNFQSQLTLPSLLTHFPGARSETGTSLAAAVLRCYRKTGASLGCRNGDCGVHWGDVERSRSWGRLQALDLFRKRLGQKGTK